VSDAPPSRDEQKPGWPTPTGLTRSAPRPGRQRAAFWIGVAVAVVAVVMAVYLFRG